MGDLMKDDNKTKKQLVYELTELRLQNATQKKSLTGSLSAELVAEEASRYAESIMETVREPLLVLDADLKIISANRNFCRTFKVTPVETIGSFIYELGNKQWDIPKLRELLEEVLPGKEAFDDFEVAHNFQDIGHKIMLLNARRIYRRDINAKMILLAIEDITEHKQLGNLLTESEERYRRFFETASDGIVLIEKREGKITHANPATEKMLGYNQKESIGNTLHDIGVLLDMGDFQTTMNNLNKSGIINYSDVPVETKYGQCIYTDIHLVDRARLVQCNIRDITDRKQTEDALRESRRHLSNIIEFLPDATFVIDRQGKVMAWNRAIEEMTGVKDEDILGKGDYEYALPFYGVRRPILIDLALEFDKEIEKKYSFVRKEGDGIWAETDIIIKEKNHALWGKASPLYDSNACIVGAIESIRDITERKQSEEELRKYKDHLEELVEERTNALRESEEKYRILVELSPDAIAVHSKGRLVYVNSAGIRLFGGVSSEEFIGRSALDFVHPNYREMAKERIQMIYESGKPAVRRQERFLRLDGQSIEVDVAAAPITYMGEPAMQLVFVDITERKLVERELQRSNDLLRAIIEAAPTAIIGLDLDGNVHTVWNQAAEKMLGWSAQEVMGRLLPTVQTESQEEFRGFRERIRRGMTLDGVEVRRQRKDGTPIDYSIYASPLHDPEGRIAGNIAVMVDITERKRSEEERERLVAELQKALSKVKQLSGLLPICASCKNIRDDKGYWKQMESYIRDHSEAEFSHGICPECMKKLYPDIYEKIQNKKS